MYRRHIQEESKKSTSTLDKLLSLVLDDCQAGQMPISAHILFRRPFLGQHISNFQSFTSASMSGRHAIIYRLSYISIMHGRHCFDD